MDKRTKGFLIEAKNALRDKLERDLGRGYDVDDLVGRSISPIEAKIEIDGLHFIVKKEVRHDRSGTTTGFHFKILLECGQCAKEMDTEVGNFISIGEILINPLCELCQKAKNLDLNLFHGIIQFLKKPSVFAQFGKRITRDKQHVIKTDFLKDYNNWAKTKSYPTIEKLSELGELESILLNKVIKPKTIYFEDLNEGKKCSEYGLYFYLGEIEVLLSKKIQE